MTIGKDIRELTAEELDVVTGGISLNVVARLTKTYGTISDDSVTDLKDLVKDARPK